MLVKPSSQRRLSASDHTPDGTVDAAVSTQLPAERLETEPVKRRALHQAAADRRTGKVARHEAGHLEDDVDDEGGIALRADRQARGVRVQLERGQQEDAVDVLNGGRVDVGVEEDAMTSGAQREHELVAQGASGVARQVDGERVRHGYTGVARVVSDDRQRRRVNQQTTPGEQRAGGQTRHRVRRDHVKVDERLVAVDATVILRHSTQHQREERHCVIEARRHEQEVIHLQQHHHSCNVNAPDAGSA